jgi:hypothetical protein
MLLMLPLLLGAHPRVSPAVAAVVAVQGAVVAVVEALGELMLLLLLLWLLHPAACLGMSSRGLASATSCLESCTALSARYHSLKTRISAP